MGRATLPLLGKAGKDDTVVLELSSWQLTGIPRRGPFTQCIRFHQYLSRSPQSIQRDGGVYSGQEGDLPLSERMMISAYSTAINRRRPDSLWRPRRTRISSGLRKCLRIGTSSYWGFTIVENISGCHKIDSDAWNSGNHCSRQPWRTSMGLSIVCNGWATKGVWALSMIPPAQRRFQVVPRSAPSMGNIFFS